VCFLHRGRCLRPGVSPGVSPLHSVENGGREFRPDVPFAREPGQRRSSCLESRRARRKSNHPATRSKNGDLDPDAGARELGCLPDWRARFSFSYELVDIRDRDGERLLNSQHVGDNVIAILARLGDQRTAIHKIIGNIAGLEESERETALKQLMILSGLRGLEEVVEEEIRKMPILNDIMDHKVLGREYKRGAKEEALTISRRLIEKRFGAIPAWAEERLNSFPTADLETLSVRVQDAKSLEDLLK
jgi:hypothetical protein